MFAPQIDRETIEQLVGTKVNNVEVYQSAFTHRSALQQYSVKSSYETLEFLGDAVLSFVITKYLFDTYSEEQEGFLTKIRTKIVRGKTLSTISKSLGLDNLVIMNDKGMRNNWNHNPKILEDVLEALIGAIYIDLGIIHAKQFIYKHIISHKIDLNDDNYKDIVMRWCQSNRYPLPVYIVESFVNQEFCVNLFICDKYMSSGSGKTKKDAEQNAAEILIRTNALDTFNEPNSSRNSQHWSMGTTEVPGMV